MDFIESDSDSVELSYDLSEHRNVLKKSRQALGLSRDYVPEWDSRDAFREFYQNWMDGMIEAHKVAREKINIVIDETSNEWIATAHRPGSPEVLGFIRFNKGKGMLELTNFNAQLTRKALDIGVTSKRYAVGQAGTHGEGFKVASLVMVRKGYQVRYESAKYYWSFHFGGRDKRHLYCHLTPMSDNIVTKHMMEVSTRKSNRQPRELKGNIWEDVTVKIGRVYGSKGNGIEFDKFQNWIKVSFSLHRPFQIVKTANGDLALDKEFGGRMFLKGLYLSGTSGTKTLKFGYNLYEGEVNRDRQQIANAHRLANTLARIWAEAIKIGEEGAIKEYSKMLMEEDTNHWADVNLSNENMTEETAASVWQYIAEQDVSRCQFFYGKKTEAQDVEIISKCLGGKPVALPDSLWEPLRKFKLVRTPEEQRHHKLHNAYPSDLEQTPYSEALTRSLKAMLALDERTKDFAIVFKSGEKADLDLLLQGSSLLINDKWLDFERSHLRAPCWLSRYRVSRHDMPCDHIITRIYDLILRELEKIPASQLEKPEESNGTLKLKMSDSLRQMPRMIEITQGEKPGELVTTWTMLERDLVFKMYGFDLRCRVTLHRESHCSEKKADVLFYVETSKAEITDAKMSDPTIENEGVAECGCPYQTLSGGDPGAIFKGLNSEEAYFPMVSRDYNQAFFGVPPKAVRPAAPKSAPNLVPQWTLSTVSPSPESKNDIAADKGLLSPPASQSTASGNAHRSENEVDDVKDTQNDISRVLNNECADGEDSPAPMADDESDQERQTRNNDSNERLQKATQKLTAELASALDKLKTKEHLAHSTAHKLQLKGQELAAALDSLENKELKLRHAKHETDAQNQRFESTIEDLEGEIRRLHEIQTENETRCAELSNATENLQNELQRLRAEKDEIKSQSQQPLHAEEQHNQGSVADMQKQLLELHASNEVLHAQADNVRELQDSNEALKTQLSQAQADHASLMTTLQGVSGMIQGALSLGSKTMMVTTLQGVLGMLRGVLSLDFRVSNPAGGTKHARIKEEDDAQDNSPAPLPKRLRQAEHIDLTDGI